MGGRGSGGNRNNSMNVPFEEWGEMQGLQTIKDENGTIIGWTEDQYRHETEPVHRPVTKKEMLSEIDAWKNDDGTYGTGDEAIYVAYKNGKFVNLTELEPGEKWSKSNISGISISTGDYDMVWGGEYIRPRYGNPRFEPYRTNEWDSNGNPIEGYENSYSGYRTSAEWKVRVKETYYKDEKGRNRTRREIIRQSTKRAR